MADTTTAARRLINIHEASERTLMPPETLRWKRHVGQLPWLFKVGRRLVAYEDEVDAWIAEQRQKSTIR